MDKNALVIYLKNLRDLEMAMWQIRNLYSQEQADCQNKNQKLSIASYRDDFWEETCQDPPDSHKAQKACCLMICLLIPIWWIICFGRIALTCQIKVVHMFFYSTGNDFSFNSISLTDFLTGMAALMLGTFAAVGIAYFLYREGTACRLQNVHVYHKEVEQHNRKVNLHNQAEKARQQKNQQLIYQNQEQWRKRSRYLQSEYQKVSAILNKAYSLNILPAIYCNFAAVYYLYNRVSNSQDTLDEILVQEKTKAEIQRIRFRLNTIMSLNRKWILQNRCKEAGADEAIQILESCQRAEANAALYAQIAANYAEANVYFNLASCLKRE